MNIIERIQKFSPSSGGVFSYAELFSIVGASSELANKRAIKRLVQEGMLFKIQRGFYTVRNPDLWVVACRLKKQAFISMDSVLAKNGLIGTVPERTVSAVCPGVRKRVLQTPVGTIRYFSSQKRLVFGVTSSAQGVRVADNEKAYLDLLYYYTKGARFVVDPLQEVNVKKLNRQKLTGYLKHYRNLKFLKFVQGGLRAIL